MKRLLKDKKTGLYLRNMDEWTHDAEQAQSFHNIFQALKFCEEHHLSQISIMGRVKNGAEKLLAFHHAASRAEPTPVAQVKPVVSDQRVGK